MISAVYASHDLVVSVLLQIKLSFLFYTQLLGNESYRDLRKRVSGTQPLNG